ncbi:Periplasmic copper-binding protein (NosD) [uncultured archaeon]|nr:Periplasmic copper-binding protein (NosD) [uncultured archaeon]
MLGIILLSGEVSAQTISSCTTISSGGNYVLGTDIKNNAGATCINIASNDVIFDGGGHTITGNGTGNGVYINNVRGIIVHNLNIRNFHNGIYLANSWGNNLASNTASSNNWHGIVLENSWNNDLADNTASSNRGSGFYLSNSWNNSLAYNIAISNGQNGFYLMDSWKNNLGNNLTDNTAGSNNQSGIYLLNSWNSNLANNAVELNNQSGAYLVNSWNSNLANNTISSNKQSGVYLEDSWNSNVYNNVFNNTNNFQIIRSKNSKWNLPKTPGKNIVGGFFLGGNFWANPMGTGFSQTCKDADGDGICDSPYVLDNSNIDRLPLALWVSTSGTTSTPVSTSTPTSSPGSTPTVTPTSTATSISTSIPTSTATSSPASTSTPTGTSSQPANSTPIPNSTNTSDITLSTAANASDGSGEGSGCGGGAITRENLNNIKQHESKEMQISAGAIIYRFTTLDIVKEAGFTANTDEGCVMARAEVLKGRPTRATSDVPDAIYFNIWIGAPEYGESSKIGAPYIVFSVPDEKDNETVNLLMLKDSWIDLKTEKIGPGTYKAYTRGFGSFAIARTHVKLSKILPEVLTSSAVSPAVTVVADVSAPLKPINLALILVLLGVLTAVVYLLRRLKIQK